MENSNINAMGGGVRIETTFLSMNISWGKSELKNLKLPYQFKTTLIKNL